MLCTLEYLCDIAFGLLKSYFIYVILILILKLYSIIKHHVLPKIWEVDLKATYGSWAVVTGATDGIGKAYAHELAKRGINIILFSIDMSKLEEVSSDIRKRYGVETEIIEADFTEGVQIYKYIEDKLRSKNIGILVNMAGVNVRLPRSFENISQEVIWGHITVNMAAPAFLTKFILPTMIANKKGAIINISSVNGMAPCPYVGIYSASKAFVYYFSEALMVELQDKGIYVQTVTPSYVATSLIHPVVHEKFPKIMIPSPEAFAAAAVSTIGYANTTCGHFTQEIFTIPFYIFPQWMAIKILGNMRRGWIKELQQKIK